MPLPTCQCVNGLPVQQQLGAIYCALLDILAASGGGTITLSQISDLDASWISPLQAPLANFSVTASQISDSNTIGQYLLTSMTGSNPGVVQFPGDDTADIWNAAQTAEFIAGGPVFSGNVTPVNEVGVNNGMVNNVA